MTKLEKLYSIIECSTLVASLAKNSREVGVKLSKDVLLQVEVLGFAALATKGTQEARLHFLASEGFFVPFSVSLSNKN